MDGRHQTKKAEEITEDQLAAFLEELHRIEGALEAARLFLQTGQTIAAYNFASGHEGLKRLGTFANAISKSVFLAKSGKPLAIGELKPRSPSRKSAKKKKRP